MPARKSGAKAAKSRKPATRHASRKPAARKHAAKARPAPAARKHALTGKRPAARPAARPTPSAPSLAKPSPALAAAVPAGTRSAPPAKPAAGPDRSKPFVIATAVRTTTSRLLPQAGEGEDGEPGDPGSLLAGPRNVQPYIPKRGEQYMSKAQLEHFRHILQSWKQDLMEEVDRTVSHMKDEAANFPDPNDRATQEEEFSLELRTRDRERKLIRKIDEALDRIDDATYGYCLETGEEIGIKRLEARPVATLSIEAQERRERRERQYGDRDDRYR
jgi:DnaK suppressor protein